MRTNYIRLILGFLAMTILFSCVKSKEFDALQAECNSELIANSTYTEIKNLYEDETIQIQDDLIIEGYIISSDAEGNFFSVLHFQDKSVNPTEGFQIEIDLIDSHLFYPVGSKIYIKLKGLYLGKSKDVFKLGGTFPSFGNLFIGRLPKTVIEEHIIIACDKNKTITPSLVALNSLDKSLTNTLVQFEGVQFIEKELGESFAIEREETERTLIDCEDSEIILLNSGFSDFYDKLLPEGNGAITGVLIREKEEYQLAIRNLADIDFSSIRCK